jgi:hypothetical protein
VREESFDMGDIFLGECPTVAKVSGSEVQFSVQTNKTRKLSSWPFRPTWVACEDIAPAQYRSQWGVPIYGPRYDSYNGLRLGDERNNFTMGFRSTTAGSSSSIAPVENQRVGVASVTLGGQYRFKYWNDHLFWWWPMADGGDQGDTAGLQFSYNLEPHALSAGKYWSFSDLSLTLRLASGIPNRNSAVPMGDGEVYTDVAFNSVDRGDLSLSSTLQGRKGQRLELGITVNSGALRHAVQSDVVHRNLQIPEFPKTNQAEVMLYMRLTEF